MWENKTLKKKKSTSKVKLTTCKPNDFLQLCKLLVLNRLVNIWFYLPFPLFLSHWSDFCSRCQLCSHAASSLVCAPWGFVCDFDTNLSRGRAFSGVCRHWLVSIWVTPQCPGATTENPTWRKCSYVTYFAPPPSADSNRGSVPSNVHCRLGR